MIYYPWGLQAAAITIQKFPSGKCKNSCDGLKILLEAGHIMELFPGKEPSICSTNTC